MTPVGPVRSRAQAGQTQVEAAQLLDVPLRIWENGEGGKIIISPQLLPSPRPRRTGAHPVQDRRQPAAGGVAMLIILVFACAVAYLIGGAIAAASTVVSGIVVGVWFQSWQRASDARAKAQFVLEQQQRRALGEQEYRRRHREKR